ncbi:hypothetical protein SAMN04489724_2520 [Algoriphagus locisalis]|uniref:ABC-2 type transport system permease protein n=1 Tax=Algoriphagus locisalis TaxID=305507 RepID=A0A1I7BLF5_9BACT|nr:hypothetical protein [Algoriphagus locisalis]SFT88010.1 hypothetical protein SAMN04489724_2520 [Algoriphagus locisalis]
MNANSISLHRLKNLIRYEWAMEKRFYLVGTLGIFLITFSVCLTIWFNNISGFVWTSTDYNPIFFGGFVFLSVFGISQGFIDLREKSSTIRYLTLPASILEKYVLQVCLRLVLPILIYLIAFWLGANLSVDIYYFIQNSILEKSALPEIEKAEILYLYWIPNANIDIGYWGLFGLILLLPILMFMGGGIFGKWGFIAMPASIAVFLLLMFGSYFGLSWLVDASAFNAGGSYAIRIDYPAVAMDVPLFVLVCVVLVWTAVFLPFIVTYLKLKEREV